MTNATNYRLQRHAENEVFLLRAEIADIRAGEPILTGTFGEPDAFEVITGEAADKRIAELEWMIEHYVSHHGVK